MKNIMINVKNMQKTFKLHQQGGVEIEALKNINLQVKSGECLTLYGQSGSGKSTLLKSLYGNYKPSSGSIVVRHNEQEIDICTADPRKIIEIRRVTLSYVSQFLSVIPRVSTLDIVTEPLFSEVNAGKITEEKAYEKSKEMLERLCIPERLWGLAPATFSGGEQQRVNIARGFIRPSPILLLDEPTASLDSKNRDIVIALINEAKLNGTAVVGIFHDKLARDAVTDVTYDMAN